MISAVHSYILEHDRRWSFIITYISLAVVLAILLNLFYLTLVVGLHGLFEWIKYGQHVQDRVTRAFYVLWELKLDIGLIFFGLALDLYLELILGMVGISSAARGAAMTGSRFIGFEHALRGILLSVDDLALAGRMALGRTPDEEPIEPVKGNLLGPWAWNYSLGDRLSIGFGITCILCIILAPHVTEHNVASALASLAAEMHPIAW